MQGLMPRTNEMAMAMGTPSKVGSIYQPGPQKSLKMWPVSESLGNTKVALLLEASHCDNTGLLTTRRLIDVFTYVLTHDLNVIQEIRLKSPLVSPRRLLDSFRHWHLNHPKTANLSIIASNKGNCTGHVLRHQLVEKFQPHVLVTVGDTPNPGQDRRHCPFPILFGYRKWLRQRLLQMR